MIGDLPGLFRFVREGISGQFRCFFEVATFHPEHPAVEHRRDCCATCERLVKDKNGKPFACGECGCPLDCALRIPEKACPIGRFTGLTIDGDTITTKGA